MNRAKRKIILNIIVNSVTAAVSLFLSVCYFYVSFKTGSIRDLVYLVPALIFLGLTVFDVFFIKMKYEEYKDNNY